MAYRISYQDHIVTVVFTDTVSVEELLALDKEMFSHWEPEDCIGHLYDYRQVDAVTFNESEIKRIALLDKNESFVQGPLRVAVIVTNPEIAKFSQIYIDGLRDSDWQAAIFEQESSALAFIKQQD